MKLNLLEKPEVYFVIVGIIFGILFCIFIPQGAGFDEDAHIVRIFDIALFNLIPSTENETSRLTFSEFFTLSYQRRGFQSPAWDQFEPEQFLKKPDRNNMTPRTTRSNYFPLLFFPQAIIAGIGWRILDFPIIPVAIAIRLIGLAIFLLAGAITIRLLPVGKWVFLTLALAPMAIFQASTLNGDGFTMSVCFLFIGLLIHYHSTREKPLGIRDSLFIAGATILLGMAKPGTIILLPLLSLLFWNKLYSKKILIIILLGIIFCITISLGWLYLVVINVRVGSTDNTRLNQFLLVIRNLADFLKGYFIGVFRLIPRYYRDWVAAYGYWVGEVPEIVYYLFPVSIIAAFFAESRNSKISIAGRIVMFLVAILCLSAMASTKFIFGYIPGHIYNNAQARYFLPFAPLLFLAFAGWIEYKPQNRRIAALITGILILVTLTTYSIGLYYTYYTECVSPVDSSHPCHLPQYKNLDVKTPPQVDLNSTSIIIQSFSPHCSRISGVSVLPFSVIAGLNGNMHFTLFQNNGQVIMTSDYPLDHVTALGQIWFYFPTVDVTPHKEYSFRIELTDGTPSSGSLGLLARKENYYTEGQLNVNGERFPNAADLFFQYACPVGSFRPAGN